MIGTNPNLDLPTLSDTMSTIVSKIVTALSALGTSITDRATPAALNITSNLSIGGNHLTNVGGLILASGNAPVAAGSIYYDSGNFYAKDATGVIQLTSAGAINLSAIGAIGGDYGTGPETFNYDLPSQEYRAKASSTLWADVVLDDLVLMEPGASPSESVRITAQAMTASYTLTLPAAVPGSTSLVQMSSAGVLTASSTVAEDTTFSGSLIVSGDLAHTEIHSVTLPPILHRTWHTGGSTEGTPGSDGVYVDGLLATEILGDALNWTYRSAYLSQAGMRTGDRPLTVILYFNGLAAGTKSVNLIRSNSAGLLHTIHSENFTNTGAVTLTIDIDVPVAMEDGNHYYVEVNGPSGGSVDRLGAIVVKYDHPAT